MKMIRRKGKIGVRRVIRLFDIERYRKKLDSMRKNRENVPLEELTTRYAKPYAQLKQELSEMTRQFLHETVLPGIRILPEDLEAVAEDAEGREIMAVRHRKYPVYGLQFHPESIMTPEGSKILENFLEIA